MSISTKRGDGGQTDLMWGRRVSKCDPRIVAVGTQDELSAALGLVRAQPDCPPEINEHIKVIQRELIVLGASVVIDVQDWGRFHESDRIEKLKPSSLQRIDDAIREIEARGQKFKKFDQPGDNLYSAHLHFARAICRRAERDLLAVREAGHSVLPLATHYLNRLSDYLWLLAHEADQAQGRD